MSKNRAAFLKWGAVALLIVVAVVLNVRKWSPKQPDAADSMASATTKQLAEESTARETTPMPADEATTQSTSETRSDRPSRTVTRTRPTGTVTRTRPEESEGETRPKGTVTRTRPKGVVTRTPPSPPPVPEPPVAVTEAGLPKNNLAGVSTRADLRGAKWNDGVMLTTHDPPKRARVYRAMLMREVVRQAVLIAARDELSLPTRDQSLHEPFPQQPEGRGPLGVVASTNPPWSDTFACRITLFRTEGAGAVRLWEKDLLGLGTRDRLLALSREAEALSRTEFPTVLRNAGFEGHANSWDLEGGIDEDVAKQLQVPNVIAQYSTIRSLHTTIRESGESPARLSALARAYANLSSLSEDHWAPATKVYAARALVYSDRLVARTDSSPNSIYTRVWVLAMLGLHTPAIETARAAKGTDEAPPPDWASLALAFCLAEDPELSTFTEDESWGAWARWFRLLTTQGTGVGDEIRARVDSVLETTPDCFAATDFALTYASTLEVYRRMTGRNYLAFATGAYPRLRRVPGLVDRLPAHLDAAEESERRGALGARGELINAVIAAGDEDRSEPSLAVLGRLLQELSFAHALQRRYLFSTLAVDASEEYERIRPSIANHPFVAFADGLFAEGDATVRRHAAVAGALVDPVDVRCRKWNMLRAMTMTLSEPKQREFKKAAIDHLDGVFGDLVAYAPLLPASQLATFSISAGRACRFMPMIPSVAIRRDWEQARHVLPKWERNAADDPLALAALAKALVDRDRLEPAARILERKVELSPTHDDYRTIAKILKRAGDTPTWLVAMKASLDYPGSGLDHAYVNAEIAQHHVKWKDFEAALPYAEAAADSWASWGLETARDVHAGLGNWDRAEEYQIRNSTRYESEANEYLFWCLETGHGDVDAAVELLRESRFVPSPTLLGVLALLDGDFEAAFRSYSAAYEDRSFPAYGLFAALLADEIGDDKVRDQLLRKVESGRSASVSDDHRLAMGAFAKLLREDFETEAKGDVDLVSFEKIVAEAPRYAPTQLWFLCGAYLAAHGREEKSREYLQLAATVPEDNREWRVLARASLRNQGVEPNRMRDREQLKPRPGPVRPGSSLMDEHASGGMCITISEDGRLAASCDEGGNFIVWTVPGAEVVSRFRDPVAPASYLAFSPDGERLAATTHDDNVVTLWDVAEGTIVERLWGHRKVAFSPTFSPDGSLLAVPYGRSDVIDMYAADVTLWNTATFDEVARLSTGDSLGGGATFTPDGGSLAVLTFGRNDTSALTIFDVDSREQVDSMLGYQGEVLNVAFSADRRWGAVTFKTGRMVLWDVVERRVAAELDDAVHAESVAVGPGGRQVVYGCHEGSVRVWDVESGRVSLAFMESNDTTAPRVAVDPTRRFVAAVRFQDTSAMVWDLEHEATVARTPERELGRSVDVFVNSIGMPFVHAPAGTFQMGTPSSFLPPPAYTMTEWLHSKPQHEVEITRPFLIGRNTVTVEQFRQFVDDTGHETAAEKKGAGRHITITVNGYQPIPGLNWRSPGFQQGDDHPAVLIDHSDAVAFCEWLSRKEGRTYRLPTEAEWEYACRAGTTKSYSFDNGTVDFHLINAADRVLAAVYDGQEYQTGYWNDGFAFTSPVGNYPPNPWGLNDVHGNVWEWCSDHFDRRYYVKSPREDPKGPEKGEGRVQRGGSFFWHTVNCRSASRGHDTQSSSDAGFRIVLEP